MNKKNVDYIDLLFLKEKEKLTDEEMFSIYLSNTEKIIISNRDISITIGALIILKIIKIGEI